MQAAVAFIAGLILFMLDGVAMAAMVRALLGSGEQRRRDFVLFLGAIRLLAVGALLYVALVLAHLSPVWLVAGALLGLALFCVVLVAQTTPNFSLFSGGKLR